MAREFFKDLPDTTTPLTATRLNGLLDGEEVIGNIVVDSIRTKNMFDKSTIVQGGVDGTASTSRISTRQELWLEAGTYTFSTNMPSTYRYGILIRPSAPPTSTTSSYDSGWQTSTSFTFTLSTSGYYMMNFAKTDNTNLTPSDINSYNFQLEEGSTTTTYNNYQKLNSDIIETGSGTNGEYIKFSNGVLIQYGSYSATKSTNIGLSYGGYRTSGTYINFPTSFNSLKSVSVTSYSDVNNNGFIVNNSQTNNNQLAGFWWTINSNSNSVSHSLNFIAIGTWK